MASDRCPHGVLFSHRSGCWRCRFDTIREDQKTGSDADPLRNAAEALIAVLAGHANHPWSQVGPCVYCDTCNVRLYEGDLPDSKRATPKCADGQHEWDDGDSMSQCGFYLLCLRCGAKEWTE